METHRRLQQTDDDLERSLVHEDATRRSMRASARPDAPAPIATPEFTEFTAAAPSSLSASMPVASSTPEAPMRFYATQGPSVASLGVTMPSLPMLPDDLDQKVAEILGESPGKAERSVLATSSSLDDAFALGDLPITIDDLDVFGDELDDPTTDA